MSDGQSSLCRVIGPTENRVGAGLSLTSEDSTAAASVGAHLECAAQQTCRQPTGVARRPGPGGRDGAREELSASDQISDTPRCRTQGCYNFTAFRVKGGVRLVSPLSQCINTNGVMPIVHDRRAVR